MRNRSENKKRSSIKISFKFGKDIRLYLYLQIWEVDASWNDHISQHMLLTCHPLPYPTHLSSFHFGHNKDLSPSLTTILVLFSPRLHITYVKKKPPSYIKDGMNIIFFLLNYICLKISLSPGFKVYHSNT